MASTEQVASADRWKEFMRWVRRFREWGEFDAAERNYKLETADALAKARESLQTGTLEPAAVIDVLRATNLITWRTIDAVSKWAAENTDLFRAAVRDLWASEAPVDGRVDAFAKVLHDVPNASPVRLAAALLMATGPTNHPPFSTGTVRNACGLVGYPQWRRRASPGEKYAQALKFFDRVVEEAGRCGVELRDRLDAQGAIWCVVKYKTTDDPLPSWSTEDRQALLAYREQKPQASGGNSRGRDTVVTETLVPSRDLNNLADKLLLDSAFLQSVQDLLSAKRQVVFYGPPGTGKTYVARKLASAIAGPERVRLVQFHPSYTYEDFVEGYRPSGNGASGFSLVPGPLKQIAIQAAAEEPDRTWILIIDELNRGNIAKVFGELFFLLEYRDESIQLQYSRDAFHLPKNLWLIGTMNTADRSIALMDAALRRRFFFVPFFPDQEPIRGLLGRWLAKNKPGFEWLAQVVENANRRLGDPHVAIGPSHFMRANLDDRWAELIWNHSILPTLQEHFFGREAELQQFAFDALRAAAIGSPASVAGDEAAAADRV